MRASALLSRTIPCSRRRYAGVLCALSLDSLLEFALLYYLFFSCVELWCLKLFFLRDSEWEHSFKVSICVQRHCLDFAHEEVSALHPPVCVRVCSLKSLPFFSEPH